MRLQSWRTPPSMELSADSGVVRSASVPAVGNREANNRDLPTAANLWSLQRPISCILLGSSFRPGEEDSRGDPESEPGQGSG